MHGCLGPVGPTPIAFRGGRLFRALRQQCLLRWWATSDSNIGFQFMLAHFVATPSVRYWAASPGFAASLYVETSTHPCRILSFRNDLRLSDRAGEQLYVRPQNSCGRPVDFGRFPERDNPSVAHVSVQAPRKTCSSRFSRSSSTCFGRKPLSECGPPPPGKKMRSWARRRRP